MTSMTGISSVTKPVINSDKNSIGFQVTKTSQRQRHHKYTNGKQRSNTILKELTINVNDLTEEDIREYAKQIGIDPKQEPDLLWIAKKGLLQKLPFPWIAVEDQIGRLYYFNCDTEQSSWEHPCDSFYRSLAEQQRLKGSKGSSSTLSMSGLTSIANLHFVDEDIGFKSDANGNSQHSEPKRNTQIDTKVNEKNELSFTNVPNVKNNNISDEEVESVDFELEIEEALEELSSNGPEDEEDLVTLDVTEGGVGDTKLFKEFKTIELNVGNDAKAVNNEFKYRVDVKTGPKTSKSDENSVQVIKDKMQSSSDDDYQSFDSEVKHKSHIKQKTNVSTDGKDTENIVPNNEISDQFLLDTSEDPFAEFDGYDQNYNDLFGSLGIGSGSGMPSKYDNSDNYEQTSDKPLSNPNNNQNVLHSTQHINKSHKPLETLLETSEERDENELVSSADDEEEEGEGDDGVDDEDPDMKNTVDMSEDNKNDKQMINAMTEQQIEYKFEEMAQNLTEKISELRNELRDEIRKQRNNINKELNNKVDDLDDKVAKNTGTLRDTKTEIVDLKKMLTKAMNQMETSVVTGVGSAVKSTDIDRLEKEMQLLRSDVRNESLDSIRELRNELNRDIKSKVNSGFADYDNRFVDFKDENNREFRNVRQELTNVSNNCKNFGQQMVELRNDLSQTLDDIERQRREHNKRLERMDTNLSEETQRFQSEVQRLETLMKTIENRLQELDTERNEIRFLSRLETTEQNSSECLVKIDIIDKQVLELSQRVYKAFETVDNPNINSNARDDNQINVVVNRPEQSFVDRDIIGEQMPAQGTGGVADESQPNDILYRMSTIEDNIKRISDSFQQMIPIMSQNKTNKNKSQNRNIYLSRKRNETNTKTKTNTQFKDAKHQYSDEDYTSGTSSSLLSSSSISDGRARNVETSAASKRRQNHKRCSHHSIPIKSKSDIHLKTSHKCCIHRDISDDLYPSERNYHMMKVPLMPTVPQWGLQQQSAQQLKHIRSSSSSLLNLIKKTTKKLREEAIELEGLGNYRFVTDFEPINSPFKDMTDVNNEETAIKKLKSVRLDVDQRLRKLTNVINQQKSSQI